MRQYRLTPVQCGRLTISEIVVMLGDEEKLDNDELRARADWWQHATPAEKIQAYRRR